MSDDDFRPAVELWKEAFGRAKTATLPKGGSAVLVACLTFGERDRIAFDLAAGVERDIVLAEATRRIVAGDTSGDLG